MWGVTGPRSFQLSHLAWDNCCKESANAKLRGWKHDCKVAVTCCDRKWRLLERKEVVKMHHSYKCEINCYRHAVSL